MTKRMKELVGVKSTQVRIKKLRKLIKEMGARQLVIQHSATLTAAKCYFDASLSPVKSTTLKKICTCLEYAGWTELGKRDFYSELQGEEIALGRLFKRLQADLNSKKRKPRHTGVLVLA